MGFSKRANEDLIKILSYGGGLDIETKRSTDELIKLASAAAKGNATLILRGLGRSTDELIKIGAAGKGKVLFKD